METLDDYAFLSERSDISLLKEISYGNKEALSVIIDRYMALVSRTSFRILCDRNDSEYVTVKVFVTLWHDVLDYDDRYTVEEWLLRKTCLFSRMRIARRRILRVFGVSNDLFVNASPTVDDQDDYVTKQAWELYCRANVDMTPLQSAVYALCVLEDKTEQVAACITGMTLKRIRLALSRAKEKVRNELKYYDKEDELDRYNMFLRRIAFSLTDDSKLRKMIIFAV